MIQYNDLLGAPKTSILKTLVDDNLEYKRRLNQIATGSNDPVAFDVDVPVMITRRLKENPFIHTLTIEVEDAPPTTQVLQSSDKQEVQSFYDVSDTKKKELTDLLQKFLAHRFAIEMVLPDIIDFAQDALPQDINYIEEIDIVVPKVQKAMVQQLYLEMARTVFGCEDVTLELGARTTNTDADSTAQDVLARILKTWSSYKDE